MALEVVSAVANISECNVSENLAHVSWDVLNVSVAQWANTLSEPQYLLGLTG